MMPTARTLLNLGLASLLCCAAATGCSGTAVRRSDPAAFNFALFIEYLVRGDLVTAAAVADRETDRSCLPLYPLFLPAYRSLDDKRPRYPVFIEKRQRRYGAIRELKRAGLVGERLDGMLGFVPAAAGGADEHEQELMRAAVAAENFDREQIFALVLQSSRGMSRRGIAAAFAAAQRELTLHGDPVETAGPGRTTVWVLTTKE